MNIQITSTNHRNEYNSYKGMRERCYGKNHDHYKNYGGRGIKVCDRWLEPRIGFVNFVNDMGKKPSKSHSIDRIDNDGDYTPENCKWSNQIEQVNNSSTVKRSIIDGFYDTRTGHMKRVGIKSVTVYGRMYRGMTFEEALNTPIDRTAGIKKCNEKRRLDTLARIKNCEWCGNKCKTLQTRFCSRSCHMYARGNKES